MSAMPRKTQHKTKPKPQRLTLELPPEFVALCQADGVEPEVVLRGFIADLAEIVNWAADPRADGYSSNGSDERRMAMAYTSGSATPGGAAEKPADPAPAGRAGQVRKCHNDRPRLGMRCKPKTRLAPHGRQRTEGERVKAKPCGCACRAALTRGTDVPGPPRA
jgi:hypothetical protein